MSVQPAIAIDRTFTGGVPADKDVWYTTANMFDGLVTYVFIAGFDPSERFVLTAADIGMTDECMVLNWHNHSDIQPLDYNGTVTLRTHKPDAGSTVAFGLYVVSSLSSGSGAYVFFGDLSKYIATSALRFSYVGERGRFEFGGTVALAAHESVDVSVLLMGPSPRLQTVTCGPLPQAGSVNFECEDDCRCPA